MVKERRLFIAMGVAAGAMGALPARSAAPEVMPTYLVVYRHGPRWADGVPMQGQQGMREHFKYYMDLHRAGRLRQAGGFADASGGAAIFAAVDDAAAEAFVAADPAVASGTFQYELKRWNPVAWEDVSKKWAEQGK